MKNKSDLSRREFLTFSAAAGAVAAGASLIGCAPQTAQERDAREDTSDGSAESGIQIDESQISETKECDVCVIGLGVAGVAAFRSAAEEGLKVVGVEKSSGPSARSSMFAAFNTDKVRAIGVQDIDPTTIANELMIQMAHRADYRVNVQWLKHCGEAFEWYADAYDGLQWIGPEDAFPEDPSQMFVYANSTEGDTYRFGVDHERLFGGCCVFGGGNETHTPILLANVEKALSTGNAETVFESPAVKLESQDGKVTGVICKSPNDDSFIRYKTSKGIVLATGGYSHNDDMLKKYAPWVLENKDKFLFSYEVRDPEGGFADTGDGHNMGIEVGGHVDVGPHAVMAHILQFGGAYALQVNERGDRFTNEDMSMTNISKIMLNQPGSKTFEIFDCHWVEQNPGLEESMAFIRSFGDGEGFSATAHSLEELADQLGMDDESAERLAASVSRYNELCDKGADEDFGKSIEKMFPILDPPFYAITYDTLKHTSVEDVSCMRLLTTMGGLVTNDRAQVLDDNLEAIPGLYAIGNTQGGRFVDDYPFSLSGASHGAALTYGYLVGKHLIEND